MLGSHMSQTNHGEAIKTCRVEIFRLTALRPNKKKLFGSGNGQFENRVCR